MNNETYETKPPTLVSRSPVGGYQTDAPAASSISHAAHTRNIGNQALQRLALSPLIQTKLEVGAVDDKYEREADQMAGQIMTMPLGASVTPREESDGVQTKPLVHSISHRLQRKENEELDDSTASGIQSLQGGGRPLDQSSRSYFEPRFGADFSAVRVHTGDSAAQAAQSVDARAFTLGNDVVFNQNQYSPDSLEGKNLLAHELTHVIQQGG